MAFHQQSRQQYQRPARADLEERDLSQALAPQVHSGPDESQTWVLFSPATDVATSASYLSSYHASQATPGRSRLSDDGSIHTPARSGHNSRPRSVAGPSNTGNAKEPVEDDAELDSLDSHLPEFRASQEPFTWSGQQVAAHAATVLPAHDGLGSFRLDINQASGAEVQDQLYAFETYNPRRVKRRRESLEAGELALYSDSTEELERMRRIEAWRVEHSQFLLAEIQRETRRRRLSELSFQKLRDKLFEADDVATMSAIGESDADTPMASSDWHEQEESDGFWAKLTRKIMQDLLGIGYNALPALMGGVLPGTDDLASTPKASSPMLSGEQRNPAQDKALESFDDSTWQLRMLERIARELGLLVHQVSTHHPGAFATYARVQQLPLPYAGLPVIPEAIGDVSQPLADASKPEKSAAATVPLFQPTIPADLRAQQMKPASAASVVEAPARDHAEPAGDLGLAAFTQREWEQDLDIKLVFRYLRSRFTSMRSPTAASFETCASNVATGNPQDAAARAARVRQYHPLVSRARAQAERRPFKPTGGAAMPLLARHASGSCASQSTRRSARRSSLSSRPSSRHYWDIGGAGSVGTGSIVASVGPMGSWGDL